MTTEERPDDQAKTYRLTESEIQQFIAAYKASGNVDKVLTAMSKGMRYRTHAREIIQAHGLRQEA